MSPGLRGSARGPKALFAAAVANALLGNAAGAELRRAAIAQSSSGVTPDWGLRAAIGQDVARRNESADYGHVGLAVRGSSAEAAFNASLQDWGLQAAVGQEAARLRRGRGKWEPDDCADRHMHAEPAVGKVFSLYYSSWCDVKATTVEATDSYSAKDKDDAYVSQGYQLLPEPSCKLRLRTESNYPSETRKANMRLAAIAICNYLHGNFEEVPSCGESGDQVCELTMRVPLTSSDDLQEPYTAAAVALAAYSKICALGKDQYSSYQCNVQRANSVVCAGLGLSGGSVHLSGHDIPGLIDLKMDDAYMMRFSKVYLAEESRSVYEETEFYHDLPDVLHWTHTPPEVIFCPDLDCLVSWFITR